MSDTMDTRKKFVDDAARRGRGSVVEGIALRILEACELAADEAYGVAYVRGYKAGELASARGDTPKADAPPTRVEAEPRTVPESERRCVDCAHAVGEHECNYPKTCARVSTVFSGWKPRPAPSTAPAEPAVNLRRLGLFAVDKAWVGNDADKIAKYTPRAGGSR